MGNWTITVLGCGPHNNTDNPTDANKMAGKFIDDLKAAGHQINAVYFSHSGGHQNLEEPKTQ